MKLKPLPTFTIRDCQNAGACAEGVTFYGDLFGMDTNINVCDILNAPERFDDFNYPYNWEDAEWWMYETAPSVEDHRLIDRGLEETGLYDRDWDAYYPYGEEEFRHNYYVGTVAYLLLELGYDVTGELA